MLSWLANAWRVPELRKRVIFTAFALSVYRFGSWLPAPGVDASKITGFFGGQGGGILQLLNLFSGSALSRFSVFALGIMPYVTASIIMQLMTVALPSLEKLQKEGESGYAKINQYTRYLTVILAALQSTGYAILFRHAGVLDKDYGKLILIIVTLTAGTTLLMWIGELITKRGVGNGISLLIFASILSSAPAGVQAWVHGGATEKLFFPIIALGIIVAVVFVQEGQRRIPIQYARRMVGRRMTTGGSTYMPLRVNMAGVIPVIFAAAILAVPQTIGSFNAKWNNSIQRNFGFSSSPYLLTEATLILDLHVLLHRGAVQPGRPGGQPAPQRRLHPRHPPGAADRPLPRSRDDAADAPGRALPRGDRGAAEPLHQVRRLLPGDLARARRHVRADRRRRRARHDAPDAVADDDAQLRRLPEVA